MTREKERESSHAYADPSRRTQRRFSRPPIGKRGYNEEEVDQFLDLIEVELSRLIEENSDLQQRVSELTTELDEAQNSVAAAQQEIDAARSDADAARSDAEAARAATAKAPAAAPPPPQLLPPPPSRATPKPTSRLPTSLAWPRKWQTVLLAMPAAKPTRCSPPHVPRLTVW
ncbi:MAG: DivIVA domain-containing protein [Lawsonella clevelandensis]